MSLHLARMWQKSGVSDESMPFPERSAGLQAWMSEALSTDSMPTPMLLDEVDIVWESMLDRLVPAYSNSPHPFSGLAAAAWDQSAKLLTLRLSLLARQISPPTPSSKFALFRKPSPPPQYSPATALRIARRIFIGYATAYRIPPRGFWGICNQYFLRLIGADIERKMFVLPAQLPEGAEHFRRIVLYGLANPFSMRSGHFEIAADILDHFSDKARMLDAAPAQEGAHGVCVIALDQDALPSPVSRVDMRYTGLSPLYMQLHELTYALQNSVEEFQRGGALPVTLHKTATAMTRREIVEVIQATLRAFAGTAARAVPRVPASGSIEIVIGFYGAWSTLAKAENPATVMGDVINQTITGVAFKLSNTDSAVLRVGEVMLFRRPGQPVWRVGVVRWLEVDHNSNEMLVGCQALGLRSDGYTATDQDGLDIPIIVAQVPTHVGDTTVLVPDHGASNETQLTTREDGELTSILLTDLRETHVDCARYLFIVT